MERGLVEHIEQTPGVRVENHAWPAREITVSDIAIMHLRLGQSIPDLAAKYDLPLAGVYAALAYYYDHQDEIDRQLAEDEAFAERFQQQNPSKLQAKLRAMRSG